LYIPDESPDDGLPGPKYVVSGIGKNSGLRDGNKSTFICKHHNQNAALLPMCLDYTWAIIFIRRLDGIILK
jgi:hypothetical protein